jgi:hypothetical protein
LILILPLILTYSPVNLATSMWSRAFLPWPSATWTSEGLRLQLGKSPSWTKIEWTKNKGTSSKNEGFTRAKNHL